MLDEFQGTPWSDDPDGVHYTETELPGWAAIFMFVFLLGVSPLVQTLLGQEVSPVLPSKGAEVFRILLFLSVSIVAGAVGLGALLPQRLFFDSQARRLIGQVRGPLIFRTKLNVGFDQLKPPVIHSKINDEDVESFAIRLGQSGGRAVVMFGMKDRATAEKWARRISRLIAAEVAQNDADGP